jgi:hypothetical protein
MNRGIWISLGTTLGVGGLCSSAGAGRARRARRARPCRRSTGAAAEGRRRERRPGRATGARPRRPAPAVHAHGGDLAHPGRGPHLRRDRLPRVALRHDRAERQRGRRAGRARQLARAYTNNKDRNPPLRYGEQAAEFGSGGLFGALAPYFLWTGVPEVGKKAPLLNAPPSLVFQPRAAAFGAAVYMQRLLKQLPRRRYRRHQGRLGQPRAARQGPRRETYHSVRKRFLEDAKTVGIDLADVDTIPAKLDASAWPGVPAVFAGLVGALPKELS